MNGARVVIMLPGIVNARPSLPGMLVTRIRSTGTLFLNTLRSVVDDDARWWTLLHDFFQRFKYQNIMTEDVVAFFNAELKRNLTPMFDQYLRRASIPTLEVAFDERAGTMAYRWKADERDFAMPIRSGTPGNWTSLEPTTSWQVMRTSLSRQQFAVPTDLYYVNVTVQ